jgi:hypothetical protein
MINPFNARMATPLVPTVRGIYADGDVVIILFDAEAMVRDGRPYHNTYTWFFQMRDTQVIKATAFFDNRLRRILEPGLSKALAFASGVSFSGFREITHGRGCSRLLSQCF